MTLASKHKPDSGDKLPPEIPMTRTSTIDPNETSGDLEQPSNSNCKSPSSPLHLENQQLTSKAKKRCSRLGILCIVIMLLLFMAFGIFIGAYIIAWKEEVKSANSSDNDSIEPITVGAYYYPWHHKDFHRGEGYLRDILEPKQEPYLGEYDDRDPAVISQHLTWSKQANIDLWVTSWWGIHGRDDNTTRLILNHSELGEHKIALFYETYGRIKEREDYSLHRVSEDLQYICQTYFNHSNYFRIQEKPVLFVYLTRSLHDLGILDQVLDLMRTTALQECNQTMYVVGDQVFSDPPEKAHEYTSQDDLNQDYAPFDMLDAVTNYDVYGSAGGDGGQLKEEDVDSYYQLWMRTWREIAKSRGSAFIPSISPGYNDMGVRPEANHTPLSRNLAWPRHNESGSLFKVALKNARTLLDPQAKNLLMVNSFNEWHEVRKQSRLDYIFLSLRHT
jgi:hypothetical protein